MVVAQLMDQTMDQATCGQRFAKTVVIANTAAIAKVSE
jgi:hypothetical protein